MNLRNTIRRIFGIKPKLNCWPGAVAHIVAGDGLVSHFIGGKTVTVTSLVTNLNGEPAWRYEGPQFVVVIGFGIEPIQVAWIPDAILRPITPPPGTVIGDESLDLSAPKQTEAA